MRLNNLELVGPQDMGKVIALLKPQLAGKADMGKVSGLVKANSTKLTYSLRRQFFDSEGFYRRFTESCGYC
jgi:hypothetical protein